MNIPFGNGEGCKTQISLVRSSSEPRQGRRGTGEECSQAAPDPYLQGTRVCPWGRVLRLPQLSLAASAVDKGSPGA